MSDSTNIPTQDKLPGAPESPLPAGEHAARAGFLRPQVPEQKRLVGFDLRTGNYSSIWQRINMGTFPEGGEGDEDVGVLRNLHERAGRTHREMAEAIVGLYADGDLDNDTRLLLAGKVVAPKLAALAESAERELGKVDERIAKEEAELSAALVPTNAALAVMHEGIRAHVREHGVNLTQLHRDELDDDTLAAVATAPAYLSGMSPDTHKLAREQYAKRVARDRVERIARLKSGKHVALQALQALDTTARHLIDFEKAGQLDEKARQARKRHGIEG